MDNAYSGGHNNSVYSIPEYKADHYLSINEGYLFIVDKEGNSTLYAVFDPDAKNPCVASGKGKFIVLEDYKGND